MHSQISQRDRACRRLLPTVVWLVLLVLPARAGAVGSAWKTPSTPDDWWLTGATHPAQRLGEIPAGLLRFSAVPVERTFALDFENRRVELTWKSKDLEIFRWPMPLDEYVRAEGRRRAARAKVDVLRENLGKDLGEEPGRAGVSIDIPVQFPRQVEAIIGQGANLDVSGSETISFRGESTYRVDEKETEYGRRSRFPQLDMKQRLRVNLDGTIGEKVHVLVNHDSEVQTALENRIKLRYEGREDEIVQKIEMGNTDLSITGAQFVSYRGTHQGLFGAKMLAQVGSLDLAVIASKREGKSARSTFVGRASKDSVIVYDTEYQKRKYYALRMSSDPHGFFFLQGALDIPTRVTIWVDDHDVTNDINSGAVPGYAFLAAPNEESLIDSVYTFGFFTRLVETQDYYIDPGSGMVTFYQPLRPEYTVGVSYVDSSGVQVGNAPPGARPDTLVLKMLKPRKDLIRTERWAYTRDYEFKHFYFLGSRNILPDDFELVIRRKRTGAETHDPDNQGEGGFFIEVLGLDRRDNLSGEDDPDGRVDPEWIDFTLGLLQFPDLRAFDPDTTEFPLDERNPEMYDVYEERVAQHPTDYQKYYMMAKYRTPQTSYSLNKVNILEGSEKVILNGQQLQRGKDYQIIYEIGQVNLIGPAAEEAQKPDANISIDFEYAPFLALAQQSLVGVSGQYALSQWNHVGFAWLYESKSTPEDRPRLGQEPSRYQVGDFNARFEFTPSFMTRMVDALPLIRAEAQSSLKLSGEVAASFPNPNTKNEVYIDDMEGVEDARILSIARRGWVPGSIPQGKGSREHLRFNWYNPRNKVKAGEVFPNLPTEQEREESLTILELKAQEGQETSEDDWIGLMRLISKTGTDFSESKFFQIRFNDGGIRQGKLRIDLGSINENFYRPNELALDTEDQNRDGILDADEDTGLDGVLGEDGEGVPGDEGSDDFYYEFSNQDEYRWINGTEDNDLLDTEDLDRDGDLGVDAYYTVTIDLADTNSSYDETPEGLNTNWRLYQIPLADFALGTGEPMWETIRYARVWFEGLAWWKEFQIASMELIGNRWLERGVRDFATGDSVGVTGEFFTLMVKNNKENPEYDPPFDPGEERGGVSKRGQREQSLVFSFADLEPGHTVSARKEIHEVRGDPSLNDYTRYGALDFWVKAHEMSNEEKQPAFFVRFATDRKNFYEYRVRLTGGWKQVRVDLEALPRFKLDPADTTIVFEGHEIVVRDPARRDSVPGDWDEMYAVYGQPTLTKVVQITAGLMNDREEPLTGEVWFNELRLREVQKDVGMAKRLTAAAQFSDLISVSGNLRQVSGDFASLGQKRSGRDKTDYSVEGKVELGKLVEPLGIKVPVSVSYQRSEDRPQLVTGSDIVLDAEGSFNERSEATSRALGVSFSKPGASRNPLIHLLVDGWSVSASRREQRSSSPVRREYSEDVGASASYRFTTQRSGLRVFRDLEMAYLPKAFRFTVDGKRRTERSFDVFDNRTREELRYDRIIRTASGSAEVNVLPLASKTLSTDYTFSMYRDLLPNKGLGFQEGLGFGRETRRSHGTKMTYKPGFLSFLSPSLTYDTSYKEDQSPSIRQGGDPEGTRKANASSTLRWTFNVKMAAIREFLFGNRAAGSAGAKETPEKTEAEGEEERPEAEAEEGGWGPWWRPLEFVTGQVQQFNTTFTTQRGSVYERIPDRPGWKYQFGLASGISPELASRSLSKGRDSRSEKRSTTVTGSLAPIFDIGITTKYQSAKDTRWVAAGARESCSRTWPDIGFTYDGLERFEFVKRVLTRASLQSGYVRRLDWSGPLGTEERTSRRTEWSPLVSVNASVRGGISSTFSVGRSTEESEERIGAGVRTRSVRGSYELSLKYSFTLPEGVGMPLAKIGGRRGTGGGRVSLNLDMSYTTEESENLTAGDVTGHRTRLSIVPKATYSFSRNMNGNLNAKFAQDSDIKRGHTTRTIGLGVELTIKF